MIVLHEPIMAEFASLLAGDFGCKTYCINISQFSNDEFNIEPIYIYDDYVLVLFPYAADINAYFLKYCLILENVCNARTIDIFMPYIPYSRQDKSKSFAKILKILKSLNVRQIFTIDMHKVMSDPFIRNILPHELFGDIYANSDVIVVAPDLGAQNRAQAFASYINSDLCIIDKVSKNFCSKCLVSGKNCLIVDDIKDTGHTLQLASNLLLAAGARRIEYCISSDARNNLKKFHCQILKSISRFV